MKTNFKCVFATLAMLILLLLACTRPADVRDEMAVAASPSPVAIPLPTPRPLDLHGIDVGTRSDAVVAKLGNPLSIKRVGENPCGGKKLTYLYKGLAIDFDPDDESEKQFMVVGLQITGGDWVVGPGVKLGISQKELGNMLGSANLSTDRPNVVNYGIAEGSAYFHFKSDKLSKIEWAMNMC